MKNAPLLNEVTYKFPESPATSNSSIVLARDCIKEKSLSQSTSDFFRQTPIMAHLYHDPAIRAEQPFANKRAICLLHVLPDLLPFLMVMMQQGLQPELTTVIYKNYPYPSKDMVVDTLKKWGMEVISRDDLSLDLLQGLAERDNLRWLVIEDGGHVVPLILQDTSLTNRTIGCIEQTTRGIWHIEDAIKAGGGSISFPVLSVPHSECKQKFEPRQIADGVVQTLQNILDWRCPRNMTVAVLGCGTIGSHLVSTLSERGVNVKVFDPDPLKRLIARNSCADVTHSPEEAAKNADIILGASGKCSINSSVLRSVKHGVTVGSVSSEMVEIELDYLKRAASRTEPLKFWTGHINESEARKIGTRYYLRPHDKAIDVLADGMPINFLGFGGMSAQAADLIMSMLLLGAIEVASGNFSDQFGILETAIDSLVRKHKLCELYLQMWS
jgi:S-adenosylhomocysteine hydrolase